MWNSLKKLFAPSPPCPHPEDYITWEQRKQTEISPATAYRRNRTRTLHLCVRCGVTQSIEDGPWGNWHLPDYGDY